MPAEEHQEEGILERNGFARLSWSFLQAYRICRAADDALEEGDVTTLSTNINALLAITQEMEGKLVEAIMDIYKRSGAGQNE